MDCGLLAGAVCSSGSPRACKSLKKQWSSKRHSDACLQEPSREWPVDPTQYELLDFAGKGAHAVVYRGRCKPYDEIVAIKRLDLDCNWDLTALVREATLMKKFNHPAVLPLHAAFVAGRELWFVTPYMGLGSVRSIIKKHYPQGLDEVVIATIMQPVLMGLEYVHRNNGIHRDVKADNILVSEEGDVVLADFGVAAARMRQVSMVNLDMQAVMATTFVGTPCWMAPEVMQQNDEGYHTAADIWSFGITLIELAHGRPPLARMNPMRVIIDTMSKPPPQLVDQPGSTPFSKAFKDLVEECLQKDPEQRPSASVLLNHRFFRLARDADFLKQHFLAGLATSEQQAQGPCASSPLGSPCAAAQPLPASTAAAVAAVQRLPTGSAAALPPGSPLSPLGPLGIPRLRPQQQQQQHEAGNGAGAAVLRAGSGFLSGPSTSGPSRKVSAWLFPLQVGPSCRLSTHSESLLDDTPSPAAEELTQDAAAGTGTSGTGGGAGPGAARGPSVLSASLGRSAASLLSALLPGMSLPSSLTAPAVPSSPHQCSTSSGTASVLEQQQQQQLGARSGTAISLEQQLQPFLQQQSALRAASGASPSFASGPSATAAARAGGAEGLQLGSTRAFLGTQAAKQLEPYLEVDGAEEEAVAAAATVSGLTGCRAQGLVLHGTCSGAAASSVGVAARVAATADEAQPAAAGTSSYCGCQASLVDSSGRAGAGGALAHGGVLVGPQQLPAGAEANGAYVTLEEGVAAGGMAGGAESMPSKQTTSTQQQQQQQHLGHKQPEAANVAMVSFTASAAVAQTCSNGDGQCISSISGSGLLSTPSSLGIVDAVASVRRLGSTGLLKAASWDGSATTTHQQQAQEQELQPVPASCASSSALPVRAGLVQRRGLFSSIKRRLRSASAGGTAVADGPGTDGLSHMQQVACSAVCE